MEQYLTPDEVAKILRCTRRYVYDLLTDGRIKANRPAGRWLIKASAVEAFVDGGAKREDAKIVTDQASLVAAQSPKPAPPLTLKQLKGRPRN